MPKQQYVCTNKACEFHKDEGVTSNQRDCYVCHQPLVEKKQELVLTEDEKEIINKYPSVIALKFYEFISDNEDSAMDKVTLLKDTYEISLRYLALLVISEYFNSELKNRDFNIWINKFYQDTSIGTVETFLELSIPLLHKLNHSFFISELLNFHKRVFPSIDNNHKVKNYKIRRLENIDSESITENLFEGSLLICLRQEFRNNYFGHGFKWTTEVCLNIIDIFKPLLIDFLIIIDFTKNYTLTNKHDEKCFEQKGFKTPKQVKCNFDFSNDSVWVIDKNSKKPFELAPFFIQLSADKNTSKILHYFFDYPSKTRIRYRNIHSEITVTDKTLQAIEKLKKKKEVKVKLYNRENISRKILSNTANNYSKNVIKELSDEGIYIKSVNQPREDILLSLKEWLGAKFGLFFISSKAGSGKTNLMINLRSEYIGYFNRVYKKKRNDILLLRAGKTLHYSFEVLLRETLNLKSNFDFNCFNSKLGFTQADPFIILVDAGNEHEQPIKFLNSILNFIKKYKGGFIKIVLTWRADIRNELPKIEKKYAQLIYSREIDDKQKHTLAQKAFILKTFNYNELAKAWDSYTNSKNNIYRPKFSFEDLNYFDKNLIDELKFPLYLRLFLEYFNGKELPKTKGVFNFWEIWSLQFKDNLGEFELLMALVEVMFEFETDRLPFDIYYDHPKLKEYTNDQDANGPLEILKTKNVISQYHIDGTQYLSITIEAFYHYLLGEFLYDFYSSKPDNELLGLLETSKLKGVEGGIKHLLLKDNAIENTDRLINLIKKSKNDFLNIYVLPLVHSIKVFGFKNIWKKLSKLDLNRVSNIHELSLEYLFNNGDIPLVQLFSSELFELCDSNDQGVHIQLQILKLTFLDHSNISISNLKSKIANIEDEDLRIFSEYLIIKFDKSYKDNKEQLLAMAIQVGKLNKLNQNHEYLIIMLFEIGVKFKELKDYEESLKYFNEAYIRAMRDEQEHSFLGIIISQQALEVHEMSNRVLFVIEEGTKLIETMVPIYGKFHFILYMTYKSTIKAILELTETPYRYFDNINIETKRIVDIVDSNIKKAIDYFSSIIAIQNIIKSITSNDEFVWTYSNLSSLYYESGDFKEAIKQAELALKYLSEIDYNLSNEFSNITKTIVLSYNQLGKKNFELKNYEKSIFYFNKAIIKINKYNLHRGLLGFIYRSLGNAYFSIKDYKNSISNMIKCWDLNEGRDIADALILHNSHNSLQNFDEALNWMEHAVQLSIEFFGTDNKRTIQRIDELIEYAKGLGNQDILQRWSKN